MSFFDTDSANADGQPPPLRRVALIENCQLVDFRTRFLSAPDGDDDIVVAPRRNDELNADEAIAAASVGQQLLRSMASAAKKDAADAAKAAALVHAKSQVPNFVGGFIGAGGTSHSAIELKVGTVVCLEDTNGPALAKSSNSARLCFKREEEITAEEASIGRRVTDETVTQIGRLTRVDGADCEVLFADGTRTKMKRGSLRLALPTETALFERWCLDPSTLPAASRGKRSREADAVLASSVAQHAPKKWAQRNLIVRVTDGGAPQHVGKKFVVLEANHRDDRMLLSSADVTEDSAAPIVSSQRFLETVIPKVGEVGLVIQGPHRGERAALIKREKNSDGEVASVLVTIVRTKEDVSISPDDYCAIRTATPR